MEESSMPSDPHANVLFSWDKAGVSNISLTREDEELIRNLPLPPCMTAPTNKKGLLWWKQGGDPFLAAYKVCTKKESHTWRNLRKRFVSISSRKRSSKVWDMAMQSMDESCMPSSDSHENVPFSWEKKTDVSKLHRPESLTREEEELLDNLPLPPCMTAVDRSRTVSAGVHQDIQNIPVPLCVFQPRYDKTATKKGLLWWKQKDDNPFLTAYKACTKEDNQKSNLRKTFKSLSSHKRSSSVRDNNLTGVPKGIFTREEEELIWNLPLPKINANEHQDI